MLFSDRFLKSNEIKSNFVANPIAFVSFYLALTLITTPLRG